MRFAPIWYAVSTQSWVLAVWPPSYQTPLWHRAQTYAVYASVAGSVALLAASFNRYSPPEPCALPFPPFAPSTAWQSAHPMTEFEAQRVVVVGMRVQYVATSQFAFVPAYTGVASPRIAWREKTPSGGSIRVSGPRAPMSRSLSVADPPPGSRAVTCTREAMSVMLGRTFWSFGFVSAESLNGFCGPAPSSPFVYDALAPSASWQLMQKRSSPFEQPVAAGVHASAAPTSPATRPEVSFLQSTRPLDHLAAFACVQGNAAKWSSG